MYNTGEETTCYTSPVLHLDCRYSMAQVPFTARGKKEERTGRPAFVFCRHPAHSKRSCFMPRQAISDPFTHFLLAKLQHRTPYLNTAIRSHDSIDTPANNFHLRFIVYPLSQLKAAAMAEDETPLAASDTDQTTDVAPEGSVEQQSDASTKGPVHGDDVRERKTEKLAKDTVTNNDCEHTPGVESDHTVHLSSEDEIRQHRSTIKKLTLEREKLEKDSEDELRQHKSTIKKLTLERDKLEKSSEDEFRQHKSTVQRLTTERDKLEKDSNRNYRLLEAMRKSNDNLEHQVRDLSLQLTEDSSRFRQQVITLAAEKRALESGISEAYRSGQLDGVRTQLALNERVVLIQQVEAHKNEAAKWKQEALGKGSEMFNTRWQASVDEAVRRKREADGIAIGMLREELAALKAEKRK